MTNNNNDSQLWKYKFFAKNASDTASACLLLPLQVMMLLCSRSYRSHSTQLSSWEEIFFNSHVVQQWHHNHHHWLRWGWAMLGLCWWWRTLCHTNESDSSKVDRQLVSLTLSCSNYLTDFLITNEAALKTVATRCRCTTWACQKS